MEKKQRNYRLGLRRISLICYDICAVIAASLAALLLRFDLQFDKIDDKYVEIMWRYLPFNILITILVFVFFKLYSSLWQFAGVEEMQSILSATAIVAFVQFAVTWIADTKMPRSYYFLFFGVHVILTMAGRFTYRYLRRLRMKTQTLKKGKRVMVVGAGAAGNMIIKEIIDSQYISMNLRCIIDDDPKKLGKYVHGVKIVGGRAYIPDAVGKYNIQMIIIAMPAASKAAIREIVDICKDTGCELQILPGMYQLMNGEVNVSKLRKVQIEDLLGREPVKVNLETVMGYVKDKVVLVTGGGGSIGSELCRQLAKNGVKQLIIVDIYENNAYDIQQELKRRYPELDLVVLIASVRNTARMNSIFEKYRPNIVYHAAAHKHVPLMEDSPNEAIKNNVFGTWKTAQAADKYGTERFVLISTDKAVNPTNIMGASKRICEMIVQTYNKRSKTEYVAVRFGNVLGSNGSVIPLFRKQIEMGGPVTVTHPDIIRYFMTIPEAVSLVLEAGAFAKGGEIFILDMGEPVKIADLARNLIKLSGFVPDEDIQIKYTGLRPGEKLYEELLMAEEGIQNTENDMIHIGRPIEMDEECFMQQLEELKAAVEQEPQEIRKMIKEIVPTYKQEAI